MATTFDGELDSGKQIFKSSRLVTGPSTFFFETFRQSANNHKQNHGSYFLNFEFVEKYPVE